jgi:hypothetical protein
MTLVKRWIEALRSGQYEQGRAHLCRDEKYCCLGVLCSLVEPGTKREINTSLQYNGVISWGDEVSWLPTHIKEKVGLRTECGDFADNSLTTLNDEGMSFSEIADLIESRPKGLFKD